MKWMSLLSFALAFLATVPSATAQLTENRMGIVSALHDYWCDPAKYCGDGNYDDAVDIANLSWEMADPGNARGFRAIKVWPKKYNHVSQDMLDIYNYYQPGLCTGEGCWTEAEFDVIVLRPLHNSQVVTTKLANVSMTGALNHIQSVTGLPRDRIFVGEWGSHESPTSDPYWAIYTRFRDAFNWGVKLGFFWNYRDHFTCPKAGGTWLRRCDETVSNAYPALRDLRNNYEP